MKIVKIGEKGQGWPLGPWNSDSPIEIGFFRQDKPGSHAHKEAYEFYLVAQGWFAINIDGKRYRLQKGDVCMVEPGEVQDSSVQTEQSGDLMCFVIKFPPGLKDKTVF